MIKSTRAAWLGTLLFVVCAAPLAFSQDVSATMINGGPYTMDGIYVGPYFTVNSQPAQMICDDFDDDVSAGESWTAAVTQATSITNSTTGLKWSTGGDLSYWGMGLSNSDRTQGYDAMLYLASQMLPLSKNSQNAQLVGYYAYAIWAIFDASAVKTYLQNHDANFSAVWAQVQTLAENALKGDLLSEPVRRLGDSDTCTPEAVATGLQGSSCLYVPEGGSALIYLLLAGASCFGAFFFRSRFPSARRGTL